MSQISLDRLGSEVGSLCATSLETRNDRVRVVRVSIFTRPKTNPVSVAPSVAVSTNNITVESYGNLGSESSVMVTTLDFEKGTRMDEIIDANVDEKRRRDEILRRRVRPRLDDDGIEVQDRGFTPPGARASKDSTPDTTL